MPKVSLYRNRVPLKLGHKHSQGRYSRLELDEGKLSRPVLTGRLRHEVVSVIVVLDTTS